MSKSKRARALVGRVITISNGAKVEVLQVGTYPSVGAEGKTFFGAVVKYTGGNTGGIERTVRLTSRLNMTYNGI